MRITIFGLGAVGGHLAARLAAKGHEVSAVARGDTLAAVQANGINVTSCGETFHGTIRATDRPEELGEQEFVICTAKATDPRATAQGLAPLIGSDTAVAFAQNGIPWWYAMGLSADRPPAPELRRLDPDGALHAAIPAEHVVGAVIHSPNEMIEPGVIIHNNPLRNSLFLGETDDRSSPRIDALREALVESGLGSPPVPDIRQVIWDKLLGSMSLAIICLITGQRTSIVREDARIGALFKRAAAEGVAIAKAHGIDVSGYNAQAMIDKAPRHLPSIRQDFERGKSLELDSMLLAPQDFARAAGLDTPCLDTIAALAVCQATDAGVYTP